MGLIELTRTAGRVICRLIREKEKMWEQHEKPAESQVLWLCLVASEEIRESETERRLGVE